ncbi:Zn-dependent hydrolase [Pseudomonas sp. MWU16-30317]|uniref:Zn-dependent hydrolase n=1 Tax=Pseudomonas sp. MWU16-30317 TaxID=2878095 RepID=UPI001CFC0C62|nr:Zn-dependent hydrolase [Pseudomonas sp. MWU16-30317]
MSWPIIDGERMLARLRTLGGIGAIESGGCTRLAFSDEDACARDLIRTWLEQAGAVVTVDSIGNLYGVVQGTSPQAPIMTGSHIDTVVRGGQLDGCYGVVAGIEMLQAIRDAALQPVACLAVAVFSNEEGVRFSPDLLGSRVIAKDISLEDALATESRDGNSVGAELNRIGYAGQSSPWALLPSVFVELHIEQGPCLEADGKAIGIVEGVQGHSWWEVKVHGCANHAGTTPMPLRLDAGMAAMRLACALSAAASVEHLPAVATIGTFALEPNAINVVPGLARFTVDFRDVEDVRLREADLLLRAEAAKLEALGFTVQLSHLSRALSVKFDATLCDTLEATAKARGASTQRMVSGASHDAQMMATLCPTAMLFVPSIGGISHNPKEKTHDEDLVAGAQILTDALWSLATPA